MVTLLCGFARVKRLARCQSPGWISARRSRPFGHRRRATLRSRRRRRRSCNRNGQVLSVGSHPSPRQRRRESAAKLSQSALSRRPFALDVDRRQRLRPALRPLLSNRAMSPEPLMTMSSVSVAEWSVPVARRGPAVTRTVEPTVSALHGHPIRLCLHDRRDKEPADEDGGHRPTHRTPPWHDMSGRLAECFSCSAPLR